LRSKGVIPHPDGLVIEREDMGHGIYWVTVYGPNTTQFLKRGTYIVAAQARQWAAEESKSAGGWLSGGSGWNGTKGGGNHAYVSKCYVFK
jgi:hypothetical protein